MIIGDFAHGATSEAGSRAKDPVCGMDVDPHKTAHRAEHAGRTYYFCSAGCRTKFLADPERYLSSAAAKAEPVKPGAIYTCPMHPEIRQVGPGSCPICGMALEPLDVTAEQGPNVELIDMQRRFWIGLALALPVFAPGDGRAHFRSPPPSGTLQLDPARAGDTGGAVGGGPVL